MMKLSFNIFIYLFFLAVFNPMTAQNIYNLDDKNGFKIFKINSNKSNYINNLEFVESNNGVSTYSYITYDENLMELFGNKINTIYLSFDNQNEKLKKIRLDIGKKYRVNYLRQLGWYLKKLYYNFEEIIGPTTQISKPSRDCLNPNTSCLYFENLIFNGKILWEGNKIVLKITHGVDNEINNIGEVSLLVKNEVFFIDKEFYLDEKNSSF